jgi:uncharacterized membrane protein YbjE (DUF340 family)
MRTSLLILSAFALGVLFGWGGWLPEGLDVEFLSELALYALVLLVGVGIGGSGKGLHIVRRVGWRALWVPIGIGVGTLGGVALLALVVPGLKLRESLAVGAGFGYYSLSSVIIRRIDGEALAAMALLANMFRELLTLVLAPVLVKYLGNLSAIGCAGATSMDTTLPIITRFSGKDYAAISIFSGLVLSVAVPFLVALILSF